MSLLKALARPWLGLQLLMSTPHPQVFVGRPIVGGDESLPYPPPANYTDVYSRTKTEAEQFVLGSNMKPLPGLDGDRCLHTCAVRPAGIWGPGE